METVYTGEVEEEYAGFWLRFAALLIDIIIVGAVYVFIIIPILAGMGLGLISAAENMDPYTMAEEEAIGMVGTIIGTVITISFVVNILYILYFSIMESSKYQGTVGKLAVGIKVTDANGEPVSFLTALVRNLCKIIS